ncbi:MAG: hypothetical protein DCF25_02565 [Leptolyngbya foveolarum]|uniref:DUF1232 domain-containing protein n=1 Tax=Leptolyngbya foveolarum TaxID=47253 RepID=A0A2W4WJF4_9CYAN|nr:MAG: hypothetical protein DCF25_02565 [Leptolyngbya foveolarum]
MKKQQKKNSKQPFAGVLYDLYRKALKHSKYRWLVILGTVFYLVNPLDFSPDVLPVLGWIDDGLIVGLLVTEMGQIMSEQLTRKRSGFVATPAETDADLEDVQTITVDAVSV